MKAQEFDRLEAELIAAYNNKEVLLDQADPSKVTWPKRKYGPFFLPKILSSSSPYWYKELISTKHKTKWGPFPGSPEWTYHYEEKFNYELYSRDLKSAEAAFEEKKTAMETALKASENKEALLSRIKNEQATTYMAKAQEQKTQADIYRAEVSRLSKDKIDLQDQIKSWSDAARKLQDEKAKSESAIYSYKQRIESGTAEHEHNGKQIRELRERLIKQDEQTVLAIEKIELQIESTIKAMSAQKRSELLMKVWFAKDEKFSKIVEAIVKCGCDCSFKNAQGQSLFGMALETRDARLFDLLIGQNPDIDLERNTLNGKTLLEYSIAKHYEEFTQKILRHSEDLSRTLLRAFQNGDQSIIELIFSTRPEQADNFYQGYNLLQLAIIAGKTDLVKMMVKTARGTAMQENYKGQDALAVALKSNNREAIDILIEYVDAETEVRKLADMGEADSVARLLETKPSLITAIGKEELYKLITDKKFDVMAALVEAGFELDIVLREILDKNDKEAFFNIYDSGADYIIGSKIDKLLIMQKAGQFGYPAIVEVLKIGLQQVDSQHTDNTESLNTLGETSDNSHSTSG